MIGGGQMAKECLRILADQPGAVIAGVFANAGQPDAVQDFTDGNPFDAILGRMP
ncbi:MAG: hypothetical protein H7X89_02820 [Rhizobiales bacterium]|nr:hypothetical protein [Hyphomicrobiales bacterium]